MEFAHSTSLTHYLIFSSWHFERTLLVPWLVMLTGPALVTTASGLEMALIPPKYHFEARASGPLTNALVTPAQWPKPTTQRSDDLCCYHENRFSQATMISLLLSLIYPQPTLGSHLALDDSILFLDQSPPSHGPPVAQSHDLVVGTQGHPSKAEETQIAAETAYYRPTPLTGFSSGLRELGNGLGRVIRATHHLARAGVVAMIRSPRGFD